MQKIKKSNIRNKWVVIVVFAAVLLLVGGTAIYFTMLKNDSSINKEPARNNTVDYEPSTDEQKQAGNDAKKDFIERTEESQASQQPGATSSVNISSTMQDGAVLKIRTVVESTNSGNCKLTLSMAGQKDVVREADTQDMGTYSTCKGFDVDTSSLAKGVWKISLYFSGDVSGAVATSSVEVK